MQIVKHNLSFILLNKILKNGQSKIKRSSKKN